MEESVDKVLPISLTTPVDNASAVVATDTNQSNDISAVADANDIAALLVQLNDPASMEDIAALFDSVKSKEAAAAN